MDNININKEAISVKSLVNKQYAEQTVEADITLPEYYQDIVRILKCNIYPVTNSVSVAGEHVTLDGVAYIKIIYVGEEQNFYCYEMSYPFSKLTDVNGLEDDCTVLSSARVESCNCRAVTSRRIDIRACLELCFNAVKLKTVEALEHADGCGIELRKKDCPLLNCVNLCEKSFAVSETVDLPEDKPGVLRVLRTDANAMVNEIKIISNKIMLKGEALLNLLYIPEDGGNEIVGSRFSVLFNEILEVPGINDTHICDLRLTVNSVETSIKARGSGEARSLEFSIRMTSVIDANEIKTVDAAVDSYSTQYDINTLTSPALLVRHFEFIDENYICKGNIDMSDITPEKIIDVCVTSVTPNAGYEGGNASLKGSVGLALLYATGDGNIGYREKSVELCYEKELMVKGDKLQFEPAVSVIAVNYNFSSPNNMNVKVELIIRGSLFILEEQRLISSIDVIDGTKREPAGGGLVIYFADKNERLWDIARKYNISSEMLKIENRLETDVLEESSTLLIPCI